MGYQPPDLLLELQRMKLEGSPQIWIVGSDGLGIPHPDLERLKQGPVLNIVSILRAVVDSLEAFGKDNTRYHLRQNSRSRLLQDRRVQVIEAELSQISRQQLP